jgi:hypothetical protein
MCAMQPIKVMFSVYLFAAVCLDCLQDGFLLRCFMAMLDKKVQLFTGGCWFRDKTLTLAPKHQTFELSQFSFLPRKGGFELLIFCNQPLIEWDKMSHSDKDKLEDYDFGSAHFPLEDYNFFKIMGQYDPGTDKSFFSDDYWKEKSDLWRDKGYSN